MSFTITPGAGTTVAADIASGEQVQQIKLIDPTPGATAPIGVAANPLAVAGTFFQLSQPVSAAALPLPAGASTEATLLLIKAKTDNLDVLLSTRTKPADTQPVSVAAPLLNQPATLAVFATAAAAAAVTLTLPAASGQFHHICSIEITAYSTAARTGSATPVTVTTTNLPATLRSRSQLLPPSAPLTATYRRPRRRGAAAWPTPQRQSSARGPRRSSGASVFRTIWRLRGATVTFSSLSPMKTVQVL